MGESLQSGHGVSHKSKVIVGKLLTAILTGNRSTDCLLAWCKLHFASTNFARKRKFGKHQFHPLSTPHILPRAAGRDKRGNERTPGRAGGVRGGEGLEVTIKGDAKEIAALVLELQERQVEELPNYISDSLSRD